LTVLILESPSNPFTVSSRHWHASNFGKHITGGHDQGREYGNQGPSPARSQNGTKVADGEGEYYAEKSERDEEAPTYRCSVRNSDGRVGGELMGQWFGIKAAVAL
jgi:hypothetical protein